EELERLGNAERFLPAPDEAYLRLKPSAAFNRRQLAALRELCAWREREARGRDLPRNHVVHEEALRQIARQLPRNPAALAKVRGLTAASNTATVKRCSQRSKPRSRSRPKRCPAHPPNSSTSLPTARCWLRCATPLRPRRKPWTCRRSCSQPAASSSNWSA
ncbi:MAG: hypothetical protein HC897_09750, partial [Thermoanaerobaculia bacterium]|nr:hypothetical protein [Thermoanaerobaculia bacterium]